MQVSLPSALIIVGVLALFAVLAYLEVPGAEVAALGAVGAIVAWITQGPAGKTSGTSLFPPKYEEPKAPEAEVKK